MTGKSKTAARSKTEKTATETMSPEDLDKVVAGSTPGPDPDLGFSKEKGAKIGGGKQEATK